MFFKVGILKNFANFTGKHLCCNFIKKRHQNKFYSMCASTHPNLRKDTLEPINYHVSIKQKPLMVLFIPDLNLRIFLLPTFSSYTISNFKNSHFCWTFFSQPFSSWCPLKGLTDLNKPSDVAGSFRCMWHFSRHQVLKG